ncbi:MAG: hypothetical protein ACKOYP_11940 [Bacteroidota bacterium]
MKALLSTLVILMLIATSAHAQSSDDFVVTTKGDTLRGKVTLLAFEKIDQVQIRTDKKTILTALQVRMVRYNKDTYRPVTYDYKLRFMKVLRDGYLSVLAYQTTPTNSSWDGILLMKADGAMMENPRLSFRKAMPEFLNDPLLSDSLESGLLTRNDLYHVVDQYNRHIKINTLARMREVVARAAADKSLMTLLGKMMLDAQSLPDGPRTEIQDIVEDIKWKAGNGLKVHPYMINALRSATAASPGLSANAIEIVNSLPNQR